MATGEESRPSAEARSGRGSGREGAGAREGARRGGTRGSEIADEQLDLLTAALLGAAIGAAAGFVLRPRPRRSRLVRAVERAERVGRDAGKSAGRVRQRVGRQASDGAEWVRDHMSPSDARSELSRYMGEARERISDAVEEELRDLRRAIRRQRRKLGV